MNRVAMLAYGMTDFTAGGMSPAADSSTCDSTCDDARGGILEDGQTDIQNCMRDDAQVYDVICDAIRDLFSENPHIRKEDVDAVVVSSNDNAKYMSAIVSQRMGINPGINHTVENMCSSGSNAIISAYSYVASGLVQAVLVAGADKSDGPGQILNWDRTRGGFSHPIYWASIFTRAYKDAFGISEEKIASIAAKNHRNAQDNPHAVSKHGYSILEVLESRKVTDDLRLFECSRPSTGAAAVLVCSESFAYSTQRTNEHVWISGIGQETVSAGFAGLGDFTSMESAARASDRALRMAGTTAKKVDVAEVHDAFAVCEAMALEGTGIAPRGGGADMAHDMYNTGNRMINPRGGLIGAGHPPGATGIAQAAEILQQLRGTAGRRQVGRAETGLVHNMSAAATSSTTLVMTI